MPPTRVTRKITVSNALPAITIGLRARLERRVGIGTSSGCSAARGLRGVIGLVSIDAALSCGADCNGG